MSPVWAAALLGTPVALGACGSGGPGGGGGPASGGPPLGQTDFVSAPASASGGTGRNASFSGAAGAGDNASTPAAPTAGASNTGSAVPRTVQETDLYRLDGTRLYYLNSYRGLMVFDVSNVDQPKLLGRSPIYGNPVDMIVDGGIAVVVVGDWYGTADDGSPFHGSIVRGFDATNPAQIKVLGEAKLGGWVQSDRVVGNVLYAVSEGQPGWDSWGYGVYAGGVAGGGVAIASPAGGGGSGSNVIVSSVSFAGGVIKPVASRSYAGYGGVFNVTPSAILLAHPETPVQTMGAPYVAPTKTDLQYLDISDPGGAIVERGTLAVHGVVNTYGADNGRWSLDFADGKTAHVLGSASTGSIGPNGTNDFVLATADFSNPDQPKLDSELPIAVTGWSPTARFDSGRMYLSPDGNYYSGSSSPTTPLQVFDLSNPASPALVGQTQLPGNVWLMVPSGSQLFALGSSQSQNSSQVALNYVDVSNAAAPSVIGTASFGEGWASTPATGTFKAFTMDATKGLVVLPFSGWDGAKSAYNNGVQLIEFTPTSIATAGAAHTHGWVERGIFVKDAMNRSRVVSLSDLALSVVDYSNPTTPQVTAELTLARNVVTAQPGGSTIAEVSSDWWGNDLTHCEVRVLPITDADENADESKAIDTPVDGVDARVFTNGTLDYIVTNVPVPIACDKLNGNGGAAPLVPVSGGNGPSTGAPKQCTSWQQQVQVVDLSNGGAKLRGKIALPTDPNGSSVGWGWSGIYYYDWFDGADVVQVNGSALAFRRWTPNFGANGQYIDAANDLFVVDLSNPDAPSVASAVVTHDPTGWWGDMRVIGGTLYTTHTEWVDPIAKTQQPKTRYYLDRIDLSDVKHPKIGSKVNVPGVVVGGNASDPNLLYTIDYRWDGTTSRNDLDVVKLYGDKAYLQSATPIDGWVGNVLFQGATAYMSAEVYPDKIQNGQPTVELHQVDLSNPQHPVDRVASGSHGWGWLLAVEGDRAMVTSGWGSDGIDIYRLSPTAPPAYEQFVRTRGWGINSLAKQGNQLFLSSGYWGVQTVDLK